MEVLIAGGVGEHGRNCFFVKGERICFLVDCGKLAGSAQQFVEDYRANQSEIIRLRKEGKYDEVTALMEAAGNDGE